MKKRDPKDLPDALAYPPRSLHSAYAKRGAAAAAAAKERQRRLAAMEKGNSK